MSAPSRRTPPWLFVFAGLPYGIVGAFTGTVMPYLARRAEIEVDDIGWFVTLLFLPAVLQFLYAPIVDFGPRRKHWLVLVSVLGAGCSYAAYQMPLPGQLIPFLMFAFAASLVSGLVGSCVGGLLATTIPDTKRGQAGAWYNIGNLCGGGGAAALATWMLGHGYTPSSVGTLMSLLMVVPSLAMLFIDEPRRTSEGSVKDALGTTLDEVWSILGTRKGLTGLLLCTSPVATAALVYYFSAIAEDFVKPGIVTELAKLPPDAAKALLDEKVSDVISFSSGILGQGLTAIGALVGGFVCDRWNRRAMYLIAGVLTALCSLQMAVSPHTPSAFITGSLLYALITGFCYSAATAVVLETIGDETNAASTRYSLFTAGGNLAITYVGLINSRFHDDYGSSGVIASDAVLNMAGVVILGLVFWRFGMFRRQPTLPMPLSNELSERSERRP